MFVMYFVVAIITDFDFEGVIFLFISLCLLILFWFGSWRLKISYDRVHKEISADGYPRWYIQLAAILFLCYLFLIAVTFIGYYKFDLL